MNLEESDDDEVEVENAIVHLLKEPIGAYGQQPWHRGIWPFQYNLLIYSIIPYNQE
jgi:hypothetical protein